VNRLNRTYWEGSGPNSFVRADRFQTGFRDDQTGAAAAKRSYRAGIFRRFCDAFMTWSHWKRIEPELEELVRRNGGRITDDLEREMTKVLTGGSDWWR